MKLRRRRSQEDRHINLTPLIDTVFLLLIFFMMTTTFNQQSALHVDLPQSKSDATVDKDPILIVISAHGEFAIGTDDGNVQRLINDQMETLTRALLQTAGHRKDPPLLLSADANAPHQAVIKVMEAAREAGFSRLSFKTQQFEK